MRPGCIQPSRCRLSEAIADRYTKVGLVPPQDLTCCLTVPELSAIVRDLESVYAMEHRAGDSEESLLACLNGRWTTEHQSLEVRQDIPLQAVGHPIVAEWAIPQYVGCDRLYNHRVVDFNEACELRVDVRTAIAAYDFRLPPLKTFIHCHETTRILLSGQSSSEFRIAKPYLRRFFLTGVPGPTIPSFPYSWKEPENGSSIIYPTPRVVEPAPSVGGGKSIIPMTDFVGEAGDFTYNFDGPDVAPEVQAEKSPEAGFGPLATGTVSVNGSVVPTAEPNCYDITDWLVPGSNVLHIRGVALTNFYLVKGLYFNGSGPVIRVDCQCYRSVGFPEWRRHYNKKLSIMFRIVSTRLHNFPIVTCVS